MAADDEVVALRHRVVPPHEALADVAQEDAEAQLLHLGLPRQVVLPGRQVGVAQHRRDRGDGAQAREDVEGADVAGVDDAHRAGQQVVELLVVVAVGVADHADEGSPCLGHGVRIQRLTDGCDAGR